GGNPVSGMHSARRSALEGDGEAACPSARLSHRPGGGGPAMTATTGLTRGSRPHVIVIGGGFGGVAAGRALARAPVAGTLVDRRTPQLFQPLLYQAATGSLDTCDIAEPLRTLFHRQRNIDVVLGEVDEIDPHARRVHVRGGDDGTEEPRTLVYDYLIL